MIFGYNTNGLAHHDLLEAVDLLAEIGYQSVAVTVDHGALSPRDPAAPAQLERLAERLANLRMRSVVETGARFLLDPRQKHEPTLVSPDAARREERIAFYKHCIACAARLGSDCVSIWSGSLRDAAPRATAWQRLMDGLRRVLDAADKAGVVVGFEPEPEMVVATMADFAELLDRLGASPLRLTLDIGHLQCQGEVPLDEQIQHWGPLLVNVHLEDMCWGVHEHLPFGEGEIDFPPVLAALAQAGYRGGIHVELSRQSHEGPDAARRAMAFLASQMPGT